MDAMLQQYKDAIAAGCEIDCYNNKNIFCERDSFMIGLTDMQVLWQRCILPLYNEGDHDIPNRIKTYVRQLFDTDDVLSIYGALECIHGYRMMRLFYDLPFRIDFSDCREPAKAAVLRNAENLSIMKAMSFLHSMARLMTSSRRESVWSKHSHQRYRPTSSLYQYHH